MNKLDNEKQILKVLVVEDNPEIAELVKLYLKKDNHEVLVANDGQTGLEMAIEHKPSILILDLMLPLISGAELFRKLRKVSDVPVIMLTAKVTENDRITGLESGADDYVVKPFSPRELMQRIYAVMRRYKQKNNTVTTESDNDACDIVQISTIVSIDLNKGALVCGDKTTPLTPTEIALMKYFIKNNTKTVRRTNLISAIYGENYDEDSRKVDTHISHLRSKIKQLGCDPRVISPAYGVGYKVDLLS